MQHVEFEPPGDLSDVIKCFWYNSRDYGKVRSGFEVVPDGSVEIIFYFGNGCSILVDKKLQTLPSPFMIGLLNQPVTFYSKGLLEIIAIRCFPWTVFDLFGLPSGKGGVQSFEHPIANFQPVLSKLIRAGKIDQAIEKIKRYFLDTKKQTDNDSVLSKAGTAIKKAKGTLPVSQVAAKAHATVRTLERKFKQSSGYTVKDVSALLRFEQARNRLFLDPRSNLAGLAHELGYTDQSHFSREFKRYSGTTPAAFARKAKKSTQLLNGNFVAFIQA